jgi:hypothetical protein
MKLTEHVWIFIILFTNMHTECGRIKLKDNRKPQQAAIGIAIGIPYSIYYVF